MKFTANIIFDFFIPRSCPSCKTILNPDEKYICNLCFNNIIIVPDEKINEEFEKSFQKEKYVDDFFSPFIFDEDSPIRDLIHELKYRRKFMYGKFLGILVAKEFQKRKQHWNYNGIVSIPIHHSKKAARGYNQSDFIVKGISSVLKLPIYSNLIKRNRPTPSQTNLNRDERMQNISNAFSIKKNKKLKGKSIILVDDIITTGATTNEAAKVLKENGVEKIFAISAALTDFDSTSFRERSNQE